MYILTFKGRYTTLEEARKNAANPHYNITIYSHKWEFIEDVKEGE